MNRDTARSLVAFAVVGLVLIGLTVGGIFLVKGRNDSYALARNDDSQTSSTGGPSDHSNSQQPSRTDNGQSASGQSQTQVVVDNDSGASSAQVHPSTSSGASSSTHQVPSTGPGIDAPITIGLVMAAVYLGVLIWRQKVGYASAAMRLYR